MEVKGSSNSISIPETCMGDLVQPGDRVKIEIPAFLSDLTSSVWALVLEKKAGDGEVWVVIENGSEVILNRNPKYAQNSVVKILRRKIIEIQDRIIPQPVVVIKVAREDDTILELRRVDGKTSPMTIRIERDDGGENYIVDHTGHEPVD